MCLRGAYPYTHFRVWMSLRICYLQKKYQTRFFYPHSLFPQSSVLGTLTGIQRNGLDQPYLFFSVAPGNTCRNKGCLGCWRGSWQQKEKEETKSEGRTPTAEAARVVQGRSTSRLRGWEELARVKGKQAQGWHIKGTGTQMSPSKE